MPTYEYACAQCGLEFEVFQSIKDDPLKNCTCGKEGSVRRKIGRGAGIIFKGTGFYETDYKRAASTEGKSAGAGAAAGSAATPTAPAPGAKPESKAPTKTSTSTE
jgi:putative FmdB family regulatory protein